MATVKRSLLQTMRQIARLDPTATLPAIGRAWFLCAQYELASRDAKLQARECVCGDGRRHWQTKDGNLLFVDLVEDDVWKRAMDYRELPGGVIEAVQAAMGGTAHLAADVLLVSKETFLPFHLQVEREPYRIQVTTHVVKEA